MNRSVSSRRCLGIYEGTVMIYDDVFKKNNKIIYIFKYFQLDIVNSHGNVIYDEPSKPTLLILI